MLCALYSGTNSIGIIQIEQNVIGLLACRAAVLFISKTELHQTCVRVCIVVVDKRRMKFTRFRLYLHASLYVPIANNALT